ncbi:transporter [Abditibacterium utsteinense]|uniref:transporter n=1 Tax=Abditibacterium utsteinense TaxID=1960156 RepID=UPI001300564E|nr:transporter [Abditibacterium utsteinense]
MLAFKLKVPTATNRDIGTGKADYLPYVILGKTSDPYVFNANLGTNFITSPTKNEPLKNQFTYDFSVEHRLTPKLSVFAEAFANSSPALGERGTFPGAVATEYHLKNRFNAFVSTGYDSGHLINIRPGFNLEF